MLDQYARTIEYVRISLTDRCNLRCRYCMPEAGIVKLHHEDILTFAEILRVVQALLRQGISDDNLKLTLRQAIYRKPAEHLFTDSQNAAG